MFLLPHLFSSLKNYLLEIWKNHRKDAFWGNVLVVLQPVGTQFC